jgi:DNA-binding NtrC family response regulator
MTTDRPKRVLIVDDDADIRFNIRDILEDLGYQTDVAADGPSALALIEQTLYDVALLDFKMPGMDGADLYREIKKRRPEIPAIMITAYAGTDGDDKAKQAGTWHVLHKPVELSELLPLVDEVSRTPVVLVVDDDHEFCETLRQILSERHFRVRLAHSQQEGLKKATGGDFDVAILDMRLGDGDGLELLEAIQMQSPQVKTILVTGHRSDVQRLQSRIELLNLDSICFKPIEMDDLLGAIH